MLCLLTESSNLLVDMMKSIYEFIMRVLEEALRVLSPYRGIYINVI